MNKFIEYFRPRFDDFLRNEGQIEILSFSYERDEVLRTVAASDYEAALGEWTAGEVASAHERVRETLSETKCAPRFMTLHGLVQEKSVLPFIGAGMSVPAGLPMWADFIRGLIVDHGSLKTDVEGLLKDGKFEQAAQIIRDKIGKHAFEEQIENAFGRNIKVPNSPIALVPRIFEGGCVTTNLDHVIESCFEAAQITTPRSLSGTEMNIIPRYRASGEPILVHIHGEADLSGGWIITSEDYEGAYGGDADFEKLFSVVVSSSSLLFMGCSLSVDRTVTALKNIRENAGNYKGNVSVAC